MFYSSVEVVLIVFCTMTQYLRSLSAHFSWSDGKSSREGGKFQSTSDDLPRICRGYRIKFGWGHGCWLIFLLIVIFFSRRWSEKEDCVSFVLHLEFIWYRWLPELLSRIGWGCLCLRNWTVVGSAVFSSWLFFLWILFHFVSCWCTPWVGCQTVD